MHSKKVAVSLVVGLGLLAPAAAAAPAVEKVTGGGQIIADGAKGPGDTIAFTAQRAAADSDAARGQLQFNQRSTGLKTHGIVDCLDVVSRSDEGGMAVLGGCYRDEPAQRFRVYVTDNGQGSAAENDLVMFEVVDESDDRADCEPEDDSFEDLPVLGRGNVKIHKEGTSSSSAKAQQKSYTQALKLAGLR